MHVDDVMALQERRAIKDTALLVRCMAVLALVIVGFSLHSVLHVEPSIVALLGAGMMVLVTKRDVADVLPEVEWPTLVFFMGLFVMVAGLVHTGVIGWLGDAGRSARSATTTSSPRPALLFGSAVLGAFFDNIPYIATMAPVVEDMVAQAPDAETGRALWWAFALGADFGGNGTAVAASANVVVIGIAAAPGTRSVLAVHPVRHRRDAADHRPGVGLRMAALLHVSSLPKVGRSGLSSLHRVTPCSAARDQIVDLHRRRTEVMGR